MIETIEIWLTWVIGALLAVSALLALIRVTIGPSVLDRVVATDVLVSIVVCALGAYAALTDASTTLPLLISLSLIGFLGSVAVARFVARDRDTPFVAPPPDRLEDDPRFAARRLPRGASVVQRPGTSGDSPRTAHGRGAEQPEAASDRSGPVVEPQGPAADRQGGDAR